MNALNAVLAVITVILAINAVYSGNKTRALEALVSQNKVVLDKEVHDMNREQLLDERWIAEFKRMRVELIFLRNRVTLLEDRMRHHNIPVPPWENIVP